MSHGMHNKATNRAKLELDEMDSLSETSFSRNRVLKESHVIRAMV